MPPAAQEVLQGCPGPHGDLSRVLEQHCAVSDAARKFSRRLLSPVAENARQVGQYFAKTTVPECGIEEIHLSFDQILSGYLATFLGKLNISEVIFNSTDCKSTGSASTFSKLCQHRQWKFCTLKAVVDCLVSFELKRAGLLGKFSTKRQAVL